jgi:hypothetical protein
VLKNRKWRIMNCPIIIFADNHHKKQIIYLKNGILVINYVQVQERKDYYGSQLQKTMDAVD